MMDPAQQAAYRQIGQQIAAHLQQQPLASFSPRQWQGLLADLAGHHSDLKTPLWDLTQRPLFANLLQQKDRVHGAIAREALLQQLRSLFAPQVVEALGEVLDGLIAAHWGEPGGSASLQAPAPPPPPSSPETPDPDPPGSPPEAGSPVPAASPRSRGLSPEIGENRRLLLLAALASLGFVAAVFALSGPWRCSIPGLCPPASFRAEPQRTLARAQQLARQLKAARTLGSYQALAQTLQRELESLQSAPLTAEQADRYRALQAIAAAARTTAATETGISRKLDQVSAWLRAAPQSDGPPSPEARAKARSALMGVGKTRFSQQRLQSLRQSLRTFDKFSARPAEDGPAGAAPDTAPPGDADPPQVPSRDAPSRPGPGGTRPSTSGWASEAPAMPAPAPRPRPVDPAPPAPPTSPSSEPAITSPVTPSMEAPAPSRGDYRLPEKWEQRRQRRREIMNQYENSGQ